MAACWPGDGETSLSEVQRCMLGWSWRKAMNTSSPMLLFLLLRSRAGAIYLGSGRAAAQWVGLGLGSPWLWEEAMEG